MMKFTVRLSMDLELLPDGSQSPSDLEKEIAEAYDKHFATIAAKLAASTADSNNVWLGTEPV